MGQNKKISKIRDSYFVERLILRRLAFFDCVLLQNSELLQLRVTASLPNYHSIVAISVAVRTVDILKQSACSISEKASDIQSFKDIVPLPRRL